MTDYAQEYDDLVNEYNEWLFVLWRCHGNKGGTTFTKIFSFIKTHPDYANHDFSPEQVEAIAMGADWKRIGKSIDNIASGHYVEEKDYADGMYDSYKGEYIKNMK